MASRELVFLKLGGSLLTDKTLVEAVRADVLQRIATEIAAAREARPDLELVLGHGSGSFGHAAAAKYQTQHGAQSPQQWAGFCEVSDAAARLNRTICAALLEAGLPVLALQPSASAICQDGKLQEMATSPVSAALAAGVTPLVYGDVAFDSVRGATIISTEAVFSYLAQQLRPAWLLLAGNTAGVLDGAGKVIPHITPQNFDEIADVLGGSAGTDVTGGMDSKVRDMLSLARQHPGLSIRIFSGLEAGRLRDALLAPQQPAGTLITS